MNCLVAGASGLIGQSLILELIENNKFEMITAIVRTNLLIKDAKLHTIQSSFDQISSIELPKCEVAFCCLGTTIKKAQSQEAFYKVDHDYVVEFAKACFKAGVKKFIVVSALGADEKSKIFYNQVKGKTEIDLQKIKFENLIIVQPSLLLGKRNESRPAESVSQFIAKTLSPLMKGPLAKVRPVWASQVARRMILAASDETLPLGLKIISNDQI